MRLAVIDCGTNTFHLLIVESKNGSSYEKVFNTRVAVKLGENAINDGFIAERSSKSAISWSYNEFDIFSIARDIITQVLFQMILLTSRILFSPVQAPALCHRILQFAHCTIHAHDQEQYNPAGAGNG